MLLLALVYLALVILTIFSMGLSVRGFIIQDISFGLAWLGPSLTGLVGSIGLLVLLKKKILSVGK